MLDVKRIVVLILFALFLSSSSASAVNKQLVAGAGPSTQIVKTFIQSFSKLPECKDVKFSVMETSIKHKGGIQNSDKFLFGRTGRPLNAKESALGKEEIFLAKVPIGFAKGLKVDTSTLTVAQIEKIYTRRIVNWNEVGGPDAKIVLVGREPTEALFNVMKKDYPFFKSVDFDKVFKKDHEVVKFIGSPNGKYAIGFGAKANFNKYTSLQVDGFVSGVNLGLVYDAKNSRNPIVVAAKKYAKTAAWDNQVTKTGMLPVN